MGKGVIPRGLKFDVTGMEQARSIRVWLTLMICGSGEPWKMSERVKSMLRSLPFWSWRVLIAKKLPVCQQMHED